MVSLKIAVALAALNILCIDASPVKRDDKPVPVMLCKDAYWKSCPSKEVNLYFQNGGCGETISCASFFWRWETEI